MPEYQKMREKLELRYNSTKHANHCRKRVLQSLFCIEIIFMQKIQYFFFFFFYYTYN